MKIPRIVALLAPLCALVAYPFSESLGTTPQSGVAPTPAQKATGAQKAPRKAAPPPQDPTDQSYARASESIEKNDFATAVAELEKYIAARPDDPLGHFQLAYALTGLDRKADAAVSYRRAISLDARLAPAHLNLGILLLEQDPPAAVEPLGTARRLLPDQARPAFLLGTAQERSGKTDAAIASYQAATKLEPKNADIQLALGRALLSLRRAAEAEAAFRAVLALRPGGEDAAARLGLAESLIHQKRLAEAAPELAAYVRAKPEDHESIVQLASVYLDLEKPEETLAALDAARSAGERSLSGQKLRAEALLKLKRLPEAAQALEQTLASFSDNAAACNPKCRAELLAALGHVRLEQREFPAAERALVGSLRLAPESVEPLRDLAAVYYLAGNFAATLAVLDRLARFDTPNAGSWFVRAISCDKLGLKAEALAAYKKFVELDQGRSADRDFQARQRIRILTRALQKK